MKYHNDKVKRNKMNTTEQDLIMMHISIQN